MNIRFVVGVARIVWILAALRGTARGRPRIVLVVRGDAGARFLVDTQRLWHVVVHNGTEPRYALITSYESGPALAAWVDSQLP